MDEDKGGTATVAARASSSSSPVPSAPPPAVSSSSNPPKEAPPTPPPVPAGQRQRFTVELRPGETTIVSWKKLLRDSGKRSNAFPPSGADLALGPRASAASAGEENPVGYRRDWGAYSSLGGKNSNVRRGGRR